MGKKITQYPNNVSTNPDNLSLLDLSEKTGASTFESRKWNLTAFKAWVNSWVVAGAVAWNDITGKPTTLSGYGITDAIDGNGTNNYVAKFTPDGNTIGNSQIQDDGTSITIGTTTYADSKISITDSIKTKIFNIIQSKGNGSNTSVNIQSIGSGATLNTGIQGSGANATTNIGILGIADNGTTCIGLKAQASNGTNKYSVQLQDGTETVAGRFLKNMTTDGKANWENITASDVQGAVGAVNGTNNYVAKFTPNGTTIGNSQIQDDGSRLCINGNINSNALLNITGKPGDTYTMIVSANSPGIAIQSFAATAGTGSNTGLYASGASATVINKGIYSVAQGVSGTSTTIGVHSYAFNGLNNYSVQLQDGTEAVGKFLKSVTNDGKANWGYIPKVVQLAVSDETTALTTGTGKITFRMPHAMTLTEVRASLTTAQTSGSILTVNVRENGSQIFTTKLTIDNTEKTSVTATTPYVLQDTSLGDDSEITVDIDQLGDGTAKGLKITLIGY